MSTNYQDSWAVLLDKGYQSAQQYVRVIVPKKKPHGRLLTLDDETFNATVASNCMIVENFFWTSHKFMGCYFNKVQVDVAMTNFNISHHLLCDKDGNQYNLYKNHNFFIGEKIAQKCKASLKNFVNAFAGAFSSTLAIPMLLIVH